MAITYRTDGEWGSGLGSNLSQAQVDVNFSELDAALDLADAAQPAPREMGAWSVTDYYLSIAMPYGNFFGPWHLPLITPRYYGMYFQGQTFPEAVIFVSPTAELFMTTTAHTAESTEWDEFEEGSEGRLYHKIWGSAQWLELAAYYPGEMMAGGEEPLYLYYATRPFYIEAGTYLAETETVTDTETDTAEPAGYVYARVAPSSPLSFPVLRNGFAIGTLAIPGGFDIPDTVQIEVGDILTIPQAVDAFGVRDVSFVLKARRGRP